MTPTTDISAIQQMFIDIQSALAPLVTAGTIKAGKAGIEAWNNQPFDEAKEHPYLYPAVFIDIKVRWEYPKAHTMDVQIDQNEQLGKATIDIHTVVSSLLDETPSFLVAEPIKHHVFRLINGLDNNLFYTPLTRVQSEMPPRHERIIDLITTFESTIKEMAYAESFTDVTEGGTVPIDVINTDSIIDLI